MYGYHTIKGGEFMETKNYSFDTKDALVILEEGIDIAGNKIDDLNADSCENFVFAPTYVCK